MKNYNININKKIIYYLEKFLDLIYPKKCIVCKKLTTTEKEKHICDKCRKKLSYIGENRCNICGIEIKSIYDRCRDCINENKYFDYNIPIFKYNYILKKIIYDFKYGKKAHYGKSLGSLMAENFLENKNYYKGIDYITYVPIHKKRMKKRTFNQSEIIAKELSKNINIPIIKNLLIRIKNTKPQSSLSKIERKNNIKDSIILNNKYNIKNKKILLIDDIYTTGSTLNECAKILIEKGKANLVRSSTICIVDKNKKYTI